MDLDELPAAIEKAVQTYTQGVEVAIGAQLDKTADAIIDYIRTNAPRSGKGHALADSFVKQEFGEGANKMIVIYSKTHSGLVHLVEFGFKHRSGKFVAARPFLRPSYEHLTPQMLVEIRDIIARGGE